MYQYLKTVFITLFSFVLWGQAAADDKALAELFSPQGDEVTIVISSLRGEQTFIYNNPRAHQRFSPASTFKILNTLISLEEGEVSGKDSLFEWDGHVYGIPDWNHDQTLESAFKVSCVWCFQGLARRVGAQKYRDYLDRLAYGELSEPFEETTFWLDGSLEISAVEQVEFLKHLYQRTFPFSASAYETLRQIMLVEQTPAFSMWAKSGWATRITPPVGWYVGYVETANDVWFFALNMVTRNESDLPLRKQLTHAALRAIGII